MFSGADLAMTLSGAADVMVLMMVVVAVVVIATTCYVTVT